MWNYTNFLEKLNHGNPSGCDAATVINGGCITFKLADNSPQVVKLDKSRIDEAGFFIVNTNQRKNTKDLVGKVRAFKDSQPKEFLEVVNAIGDVT